MEKNHKHRLHHVGFAVDSIQAIAQSFARSIGAEWDRKIIEEPSQGVRVTFLCPASKTGPLVELVEGTGEDSPVANFLKKKGGGLHHLCYEVPALEKELERSRSQGGLIVKGPLPAVAFGGRRIAWVYTTHRLLLEYLEQ